MTGLVRTLPEVRSFLGACLSPAFSSAVNVMSVFIGRGSLIEGSAGVVGRGMADGGWVVVRGDDDVVDVGLGDERQEERVGVGHPCCSDLGPLCDEAVAPAHGPAPALAGALDEEQGGGADLGPHSKG